MQSRILSVSYDVSVLETRRLLLEREGYSVVSCSNLKETLAHCQTGVLDLVLIGHSIPPLEQRAIVQAVNSGCHAPILQLLRDGEPYLWGAAVSVSSLNVVHFLTAVRELLSKSSEASAYGDSSDGDNPRS